MSPVYRAFPAQPVLGPTFTSGSASGPNGSPCPRPPTPPLRGGVGGRGRLSPLPTRAKARAYYRLCRERTVNGPAFSPTEWDRSSLRVGARLPQNDSYAAGRK